MTDQGLLWTCPLNILKSSFTVTVVFLVVAAGLPREGHVLSSQVTRTGSICLPPFLVVPLDLGTSLEWQHVQLCVTTVAIFFCQYINFCPSIDLEGSSGNCLGPDEAGKDGVQRD